MLPAHSRLRRKKRRIAASAEAASQSVSTPAADCDASGTSDEGLLQALQRGDEAAFAALVDRHQASLVRVAKRYVRGRAAAEDVVQETWVGFMIGLERFEGRCSIRTWLFRILFNKAQSRVATEKRLVPFSCLVTAETESDYSAVDPERFRGAADDFPGHWLNEPPAWKTDPARILADQESRAAVRVAMDDLPKAQATVMQLRDVEGLPSDEVCEILGISPANQRVLLHRARSKVRAALERRFGANGAAVRA